MPRSRLFLAALALLAALPAAAADRLELLGGMQAFRWIEYTDGERLLTEHGPLATFTGAYRIDDVWAGTDFRAEATMYGGGVDYDGSLSTGSRYLTTTDYVGARSQGAIVKDLAPDRRLAPLLSFAAGVDIWQRQIAHGDPPGYIETYQLLFLRAGGGVRLSGADGELRAIAGLERPVWINERVDFSPSQNLDDFDTRPVLRTALFLELGQEMTLDHNRALLVRTYYRGYRFDASKPNTDGWYQPRSHADILGVQIGLAF